MLLALPSIDRRELFARLADSASRAVVVTSSRRLAQAVSAGFDAGRVAAGIEAWQTPDVLPFGPWVERFWNDALYSDLAAGLPLLLSPVQERALWEECIRAAQREPLLCVPAAADEAMQAWSLAHEWRLAARLASSAQHDDARAFVAWATRYERITHERRQLDGARLPEHVVSMLDHDALRKPAAVVLAGFDLVTPQQAAFLQAIGKCGASVERLQPAARSARNVRVSFPRAADEVEAAARWARSRLEANPGASIAVVVPDLARLRRRVERVFTQVMAPPGAQSPLPFNISLGLPLAQWPIVHDALALLRLAGRELPFEQASALLRSPFIGGAEDERAARDVLDAALRRRSGAHVSLDALVRLVQGSRMPAAPRLRALLESLAQLRRTDLFARRGAAEWARAMESALRHAGFPGERSLDSAEYQAWSKWHEALGELASLERVLGAMGYGEACERLARVAGARLFQPETPAVPIQVLGLLEPAGLDFDALWVMGLAEDAWPMPVRANPFIPLALQRSAGIPHADPAASLALDERITQSWKRSADEVVFSHARMREDAQIGASALVSDIAESPLAALAISIAPSMREAARAAGKLLRIADGTAPPVAETARAGGTRLFRDQAACPFRAFARHRVASAALERPEPGLDAAARGTLLHEMLANVWRALGDKARLDAIATPELDRLLVESADSAIGTCRRFLGDALAGRFEALERERLVGTAREWLALERTREAFSVVAVEEKRAMTFGGISVNVKLDRMDDLAQGGRAVIDYKAGVATVSSWLGPRPDEPQLPMYAVGSGDDVRAVAFARLKRGNQAFSGFGMEANLLPKVDVIQKSHGRSREAREYRDWGAMVAGWRSKLDALGAEFAQGVARVDPKTPGACEQCDQQPFCRIAEKR